MENLANEYGVGVCDSLLQNTDQNTARGPRNSRQGAQKHSGPPESQCLLLPSDWKSVDQLIS